MKILYLKTTEPDHPSFETFVEAIDGRFPIDVYDPQKPLLEQLEGVEVVVDSNGAAGTREIIDAAHATGVKLWQVCTNGLDHVDAGYILEKGIPFSKADGQQTGVPLAEHVMYFMLFFAKNLHLNHTASWSRAFGEDLDGKTLGLIGFGASAREVARRAWPMGVRVEAIDIVDMPQALLDELHVATFGDLSRLNQVLSAADYISLHVPLNPQTRHIIDARAFELMKPSSVLINVARGELVDEAALIEALQNGRIKGAGLDAFASEPLDPDHPFLHLPNVVTTPHMGAFTIQTWRRRSGAAAENVARVSRGLPPLHLVNSV